MRRSTYPIDIGDPEGQRFERVEAAVDTGVMFSIVPGSLLQRLGVPVRDEMLTVLPNGHHAIRQLGETQIRIGSRTSRTLVVFGTDDEEVVLGEYALNGAMLAVDPAKRRLVPIESSVETQKAE